MDTIKQKNIIRLVCVAAGVLMASAAAADSSSTEKTPKNSNVTVEIRTYELTPQQISTNDQAALAYAPNATKVAPSSRRYNCHSYAWYSQSVGTNNRWIHGWAENVYMTDGSYAKSSPTLTPVGGKVSYPSGDHSAIKYSDTLFTSKWGQLPLMRHKPLDAPYVANNLQYYTLYSACPFGAGKYCGDPARNQSSAYLYSCSGGTYTLASTCNNKGCKRNPPGVNDACNP